ncbi:MAG: selenocysteine-specific translation elongation factor [Phycisphaerales bacterium]|nr:selenocysteine-specific translation elongation factor [Phycisphaerales bacterium]
MQTQSTDSPGSSVPRHFILGTAGHIDHGKTSLVKALTGIDADRLPEERARGMTIELGFAHFDAGDCRFSVVDVPGHERFVRTMAAGAQGIDVAVLVVAADDSVMPQTVEHVEILELLGVRCGVVALSKADRVDADMVRLVGEEVAALLKPTGLDGAEIVPVSSITGAGMEELKAAIVRAAGRVKQTRLDPPFRMCIDRVFSVQGRGLVVTGSVLRGSVSCGDALELLPAGLPCRVRQLQSHGEESSALSRGTRAALNLIGVERDGVERGMELATPGYLAGSRVIDVRLSCLPTHVHGIRSTSRARLCMGTRESVVRIVLLHGGTLAAGESAHAQLRCGQPLAATFGQRFILRDETAARTLGGGIVLRPAARRRRIAASVEQAALQRLEQGSATDRLEESLRASGFTPLTGLRACAATGIEPDELPAIHAELSASRRWVLLPGAKTRVVPAVLQELLDRLTAWMTRFHRENPDAPGRAIDAVIGWLERRGDRALGRVLFEHFLNGGAFKILGKFVCLPQFAPALSRSDERALQHMIEAISSGGFSPPTLDEIRFPEAVDRKRLARLATLAVATGQLVHLKEQLYLSPGQEQRLKEKTAEAIQLAGGASVSQIREALDTSRKYCVPYLEYLDQIGWTRRVGDVRVLASMQPA